MVSLVEQALRLVDAAAASSKQKKEKDSNEVGGRSIGSVVYSFLKEQ